MKVLVLGGTGAMGRHLVACLAGRPFETHVTSRKTMKSSGSIRYVPGNAQDTGFLESLLVNKWGAIVDFMVYRTPEFERRIEPLLQATSQYVFLSSARVYAESTTPITEESPRLLDVSEDRVYLATDEYALAKARQEDILLKSGKTNWTILRPYITYAENRLQLGDLEKEEWLYRALEGRPVVFSRDIIQKHTTMTHGADVARAIAALIGSQAALGQVFQATSERTITWREVLDIYLVVLHKHLGAKPRVVLQDIEPYMKWKRAPYQTMYDRLYDRSFSSSKLSCHIDVSQFTDPSRGIQECLERFLSNAQFGNIDWRGEAIKDRQTKALSSLREIPTLKSKARYMKYRFL